ncbi:hypothetical protein H2199_006017 [Coniosporium tulheliwenetii]|uniref:Uncharacterized protein n=1 Tax=Coniosporium tulheliwenetii TaxID=3383036 RepID=A0ACC2YZ63_9PEZI|nr:hypothetical protein H2199_006017 [Cladosporium sp. JES 115]
MDSTAWFCIVGGAPVPAPDPHARPARMMRWLGAVEGGEEQEVEEWERKRKEVEGETEGAVVGGVPEAEFPAGGAPGGGI